MHVFTLLMNMLVFFHCKLWFVIWSNFPFLWSSIAVEELFHLIRWFLLCLPIKRPCFCHWFLSIFWWEFQVILQSWSRCIMAVTERSDEHKQICLNRGLYCCIVFNLCSKYVFLFIHLIMCHFLNPSNFINEIFKWPRLICRKSQRVSTQDRTLHCDWRNNLTCTWLLWQTGKRIYLCTELSM